MLVNTYTEPATSDKDFKPQARKISLEPAVESLAKLLALTVDHVDTLLEDWYPSIGTRFVHTSEGKYLVTRLIPCPRCYPGDSYMYLNSHDVGNPSGLVGRSPTPGGQSSDYLGSPGKLDAYKGFGFSNRSPRMSSDSGVGHSPGNTRVSSVDSMAENEDASPGAILFKTGNRAGLGIGGGISGVGGLGDSTSFSSSNFTGLNFFLKGSSSGTGSKKNVTMYSWSVEYCILHSQKQAEFCTQSNSEKSLNGAAALPEISTDIGQTSVKCPKHGEICLNEIAPDILFMDLNFRFLLKSTEVKRGNLLGRLWKMM